MACNDFLDTLPDNRVDLSDVENNAEMITDLLSSGYPTYSSLLAIEMMSDNIDKKLEPRTLTYRNISEEEAYRWTAIGDGGNDNINSSWESAYKSIAVANVVLEAIAKAGNPENMNPQRGEALMIRAYNHFTLVSFFAPHYKQGESEGDVGIAFIEHPETEVNPQYVRESVAEVYRKIDRDIEAALPLIDDALYGKYAKYHFNQQAAYALAARFNLYYGQYDKAIEYANVALGEDLSKVLRKKSDFKTLANTHDVYSETYTHPANQANFLILTLYSNAAATFGNYTSAKLYQHTYLTAFTETVCSDGPWGTYVNGQPYPFYFHPSTYASSTYVVLPTLLYKMEIVNQLTGSGYPHAISVAFTAEETLLCRAEAHIVKGDYERAAADLIAWYNRQVDPARVTTRLTRDLINSYYGGLDYYTPTKPTAKKRLNPLNFTLRNDGEMENFLHCLLHFRRIETIHQGLRWFDVKRFGIVIYRRDVTTTGQTEYKDLNTVAAVTDSLTLNDYRRAAQIPSKALIAGMQPTPGY
jgi:tetratricopeptide (TPR) repeat protein